MRIKYADSFRNTILFYLKTSAIQHDLPSTLCTPQPHAYLNHIHLEMESSITAVQQNLYTDTL